MRLTPTAVALPLLLLLLMLTWLLVRGINTDAELFDRTLEAIDQFATTNSALGRDVLATRAGLLRTYDPLVRELKGLYDSLDRLREAAAVDADLATAIERLATSVGQQEQLVELFKSDNALLQNSLAYFGRFSANLSTAAADGPLIADVSGLAAAILHLSLDSSPAAAREVQDRLDSLSQLMPSFDDVNAAKGLLVHGQMLHNLLPATDGLLKALFALPIRQDQVALRNMIVRHQIHSRDSARQYRLVLYAVAVMLLALLIHLGLQLRERAMALRDRAAFEHFVAGISTRFINAQPQQVSAHVEQSLAELAQRVGADRAYFVWRSPQTQRYLWSRDGGPYPPNWPDQALALAARFDPTKDGVIHIRRVDRLPSGADRDALADAGLSSWACVSHRNAGAIVGLLGFDVLGPFAVMRHSEFGLLRMALDALTNAVGREQLEQERTRLESRLQQARHMETVGVFASGIAHNFNNIVGAILGYTEMAEGQVEPDSRPARNLREIRRAGERARDLIEQILTFGRRRQLGRRAVGIQGLVAEAASLLRASLPSAVELTVRVIPEGAVVLGDPGQLQQVILNLCNNASQAMDEAGAIDIKTEIYDVTAESPLPHRELASGRYAVLSVSDHGRGMDQATLERIFEPFFTTRLAGNGLGLATVQEIVREHGGTVIVQSKPGFGSRFEVWLPCVSAAELEMTPDQDTPDAIPFGRGETVLVIDSDRDRLLRDEEMLAALGYEPVGFARVAGALAACKEAPDRFDALLVSHPASAAAALALAKELHGIAPSLPVLLAANSVDDFNARDLVDAGVDEVVRQPLASSEIAAALARCLPAAADRPVSAS